MLAERLATHHSRDCVAGSGGIKRGAVVPLGAHRSVGINRRLAGIAAPARSLSTVWPPQNGRQTRVERGQTANSQMASITISTKEVSSTLLSTLTCALEVNTEADSFAVAIMPFTRPGESS